MWSNATSCQKLENHCTNIQITHFATRDSTTDSVLLKQDIFGYNPYSSHYSKERTNGSAAAVTDQTIYAYRNPPSHQEYYEQTNRFSLERICPSTLQVVRVKPVDQNLDSTFVPKRLWSTYCE